MPRLKMLTVVEAAPILGVSPLVCRRMLAAGQLSGTKYGEGRNAKWRVAETEIERFINQRTAKTRAAA